MLKAIYVLTKLPSSNFPLLKSVPNFCNNLETLYYEKIENQHY